MHNSNLIQLMKSLTPREINILHHFINTNCPNKKFIFLKTNTTVSTNKLNVLYEILKKEYPEFTGDNIRKETVFQMIYPDEPYSDKKIRNLQHELTKIIEFYLIHLDIVENHTQFRMHLLNQLEKRKFNKLYYTKIHTVEEELENSESRDEDYYYQKYALSNRKRIYNENKTAVAKNELTYDLLADEINNFTNHFTTVIFKQLSLAKYFKQYVNIEINTDFYDYVIKYFNEHPELVNSNPSLLIWNKFLTLYEGKADKNGIIELKEMLDKNKNLFKTLDYQYLYTDLLNICIRQYPTDKEIIKTVLKDCITNEVYIRNGYIHEQNYTTIVLLALSLDEVMLAEDFLEKYKDSLLPEYRGNTYSYNFAHIYFKLGKYERALEMLRTVKSNDYFFKIGINDLLLKIFYETSTFEAALSLIDSYRHFISKNENIPPEYKENHEKFIKYYRELIKIKAGTTENTVDYILKKLNIENNISYKSWLLEKLNELHPIAI